MSKAPGSIKDEMAPGDEAPPGTAGTGEMVCPACHGSGQVGAQRCETCGGTGKIVKAIGGA
jgi:DnaJ-class molecular chaperone